MSHGPKPSRNEPCPCGSGRKYKKCHGAPGASSWGGEIAAGSGVENPRGASSRIISVVICLLLAFVTLAIYAQTANHGYVAYDDDQYVYKNPWVQTGITASNVGWAFTTFFYSNWHPLTWISYMLDFSLFGSSPGAQHLVNVALHLASALLLFLALVRMTHQPWRCAVVAAIFAVHPLHVESVAWISERKDVLSTFFEMLTLWFYVGYAAKPAARRYLMMAAAFGLSLLAKPMAVTFPFVLLLLDYWPLGRLQWPLNAAAIRRVVTEKVPLLVMTAVTSVLTFLAQRGYGAVVSLNRFPFPARLANAAIAYVAYIGKTFWPADLGVLYPARGPELSSAVFSLVVLSGVMVTAWLWVKQRPYLAVGWLWYLGMLVPVIGLVQVGSQAMADRYTYVPMVGFSIALVWTVGDLVERRSALRIAASVVTVAALAVLSIASYRQAAYWKTSRTLFEHTLSVTSDNSVIQNNLGVVIAGEGNYGEAINLYRAALSSSPDYAEAQANLGHELLRAGKLDEAQASLAKALVLNPNMPLPQADMGVLMSARGDFEAARRHIERSLALAPGDPDNESNLCFALVHLGRTDEAIVHCNKALRIKPGLANAQFNLKTALAAQKHGAQ